MGYQVFRDNILVDTVNSLSYIVEGLAPGESYTFTIRAIDGAGNLSVISEAVSDATLSYTQLPFIEDFETVGPLTDDPAAWDLSEEGSFLVESAITWPGTAA